MSSSDDIKDIIDKPQQGVPANNSDPKYAVQQGTNPIKFNPGDQKNINDVISTNWNFGKVIFQDDAYAFRILEIEIPDSTTGGTMTGYSVGQYIIKGDRKTKWLEYNQNALYYIRKGVAWFMIGDEGAVLLAGNYICVPRNTKHSILNKNTSVGLQVDLIFGGRIARKF